MLSSQNGKIVDDSMWGIRKKKHPIFFKKNTHCGKTYDFDLSNRKNQHFLVKIIPHQDQLNYLALSPFPIKGHIFLLFYYKKRKKNRTDGESFCAVRFHPTLQEISSNLEILKLPNRCFILKSPTKATNKNVYTRKIQ